MSEPLSTIDPADAVSRRTPAVPIAVSQVRRRFAEHSIVQLTLTRFREFLREPEAVFWSFVFPLLLATGLGIAFKNRPADVLPVGVLASRDGTVPLAPDAAKAAGLSVKMLDSAAATEALRTGAIALLAVPVTGGMEYRYDPTRPEARSARLIMDQLVQRQAGRRDPVPVRDLTVSERGSRYIDFFLPGLLGMNLMGSGIWGLGFSIVTARNKKLLKRLVATPMSRAQFLLSYLLSRLFFLIVEVAVLIGFGVLAFGVPVRGSIVTLAIVCLASALAFSAIGLLISSRAQTTEGVSGLMNLVMLPMWVFSGVFFSSANFPAAFQPFIRVLPLTAVNDALRATMLRGAGLGAIAPELAIIIGWMVLSAALALRIFRWR